MPTNVEKIIVTNARALNAKYGKDGWGQIKAAISRLIAADAARGIKSALVAIDDAGAMKKLKGKPVVKAGDPRQNKAAIDAVYKALTPDYVMILGAVDVVPHQDMINPASDDGDPIAFGDLPYACDKPYSQQIESFTAVTRVVGRLPDTVGDKDPAHLVGLLDVAAQATPRPPSDYQDYLGMTAAVWQGSTTLSLKNVFGTAKAMQQVPPRGPPWSPANLGTRAHFINCHGAPAEWRYFGQRGNTYPVAHDATLLSKGLAEGTVVAAECCYGAELHDPASTGGRLGMVDTYLAGKTYGFFGSSTIAYGPADTNGQADLICQYFMKHVLAGASLGRAALQARQEFVASAPVLDPTDLKTLAQFSLMGDPSIQPVQAAHGLRVLRKSSGAPEVEGDALTRALRRKQMAIAGVAAGAGAAVVDSTTRRNASASIKALLQSEMRTALQKAKLPRAAAAQAAVSTFTVRAPTLPALRKAAFLDRRPSAVHMAIARADEPQAGVRPVVIVVAIETGGTIVSRTLFSR